MFNIDWPDLSFGPINLWNVPKMEDYKSINEQLKQEIEALRLEMQSLKISGKRLQDKINSDSWKTSPDRMGGSFDSSELTEWR